MSCGASSHLGFLIHAKIENFIKDYPMKKRNIIIITTDFFF